MLAAGKKVKLQVKGTHTPGEVADTVAETLKLDSGVHKLKFHSRELSRSDTIMKLGVKNGEGGERGRRHTDAIPGLGISLKAGFDSRLRGD